MGRAMLSAVLDRNLSTPGDIAVSDVSAARLKQLEREFGIRTAGSNPDALSGGDVVILAVKPQNLADVMAEIGGLLETGQLVLSIIAGKKLDTLRHGLGHDAVVRAMPNTPAQIGRGVTVWTATSQVSGKQQTQAAAVLGAMGSEIYVVDEGYLDMATAVSGRFRACISNKTEKIINFGCCYSKIKNNDYNLSVHSDKSIIFNERALSSATQSFNKVPVEFYQYRERIMKFKIR